METIQVKMAKASKDDIERCRKFFQFVEEFMEYGTHTPENDEVEEDSLDLTDEMFVEKLREMWGGRMVRRLGVDTCWTRVVVGCDMLIDNCCDPEADCLELRQDWEKAIAPPAGIDEALEHLNGNKEHFRKVLLDKTEILKSMCDYARRTAKKKKLPPWSIIGDITGHGSGVSSAIYELYRRKPKPIEAAS